MLKAKMTDNGWICPHCDTGVSHVKEHTRLGNLVISHYRHKTPCPYSSEPESQEHLQMKLDVYDRLKHLFKHIELEVKLEDRIADIYGILKNGQKIAIECQVSPISIPLWEERTLSYARKGIGVLWILHPKKFLQYTFSDEQATIDSDKLKKTSIKTKALERHIHKINFGRVYYYDPAEKAYPIFATHFNWIRGTKMQKMAKIKQIEFEKIFIPSNKYHPEFRLARFYDKVFWK